MKKAYSTISGIYKQIAKYIFSFLIVICPIMTIYASPIPKVTLIEFLLLIFVVLTIVFDFKRYKFNLSLIYFILAIFINLILMICTKYSPQLLDDIGTALRLLFNLLLLVVFSSEYFDYKISLKILVITSIVLCGYALMQLLFSFKQIYLWNFIPLLKQLPGDAGSMYESIVANYKNQPQFYRMLSLFREPAHFATYLIIPGTLLLLKKDKSIYSTLLSFFFFVVAMATLSSTGIILSSGIIVTYVVYLIIDRKLKWWQIIIVVSAIAVIALVFVFVGGWNYFASKTFGEDKSIYGILNDSRLSVLPMFFKSTPLEALFGRGLASHNYYMATYVRTIYSLGMIGIICLSISFASIYMKINKRSLSILFFVFVIINIGTENLYGALGLPFIAFLLSNKEEQIKLFRKFQI